MRPCAHCVSRNVLCVMAAGCEHCEQCYRSNRRCELAPPCAEIERLSAKGEELSKQALELETKSLRIQREQRRIRQKIRALEAREDQNIADLKLDEAAAEALELPIEEQPQAALSPTRLS
jgi:chromosome segregation ATPase